MVRAFNFFLSRATKSGFEATISKKVSKSVRNLTLHLHYAISNNEILRKR